MKKIIYLAAFIFLSFNLLAQSTSVITLELGTVTATPGQLVSVPVKIYGANGPNAIVLAELYISHGTGITKTGTGTGFADYHTLCPAADWVGNMSYSPTMIMNGWIAGDLFNKSFPDGSVMFNINVVYNGPGTVPFTWGLSNAGYASFVENETVTLLVENGGNVTLNYVNGGIVPAGPTLSAPTLSLPANNATNVAINPVLEWNSVNGATGYVLQVSTSSTFTTTVVNQSVTGTTYNVSGLNYNTTYYWRVKATDGTNESDWSSVWSFTTAPQPSTNVITLELGTVTATPGQLVSVPVKIYGANGPNAIVLAELYISHGTGITKTGTGTGFADYHTLCPAADWVGNMSYSPTMIMNGWIAGDLFNKSFPDGSVMFNINVVYNGPGTVPFTWGLSNAGYASFVENETVTLLVENGGNVTLNYVNGGIVPAGPTLSAPTLSLPANNATNVAINPVLEWNSVNGATGYVLQVSTSSTFTTTVVNQSVTGTTYNVSGLNYNTTYYWRVKATDGTNESDWSSVWSFTTMMQPLTAVSLYMPLDGATNVTLSPTLEWQSVATATGYEVQVSTSNTFTTTVYSGTTTNLTQALSGLSNNTTYYWRVRALRGSEQGPWSAVWSFTTIQQPLTAVVLSAPANGANNVTLTPTLEWQSVATATGYEVQVSTSNTFTTTVYSGTTTNLTQALSGLSYNTTYYWRVRALRGTEQGPWSAVWSFTTELPNLTSVILTSPANNATNVSINPTLQWQSVATATGYEVQVSTSNTFTTTVFSGTTANLYHTLSGLNYNTTYYWRVRALRGTEQGPWSAVWSFTTIQQQTTAAPTQASFITFSQVTPNSMKVTWLNGNGVGRLLLVADENLNPAQWNAILNALNANVATYSGVNGNWNNKVAVTAAGKTAYVIGRTLGTVRSVDVTGLTPGTTYYFHVAEYNGSNPAVYNVNQASLNPRSKATLLGVVTPVAVAATNVTTNSFFANWTLASNQYDYFEADLNGDIVDVGAFPTANGFTFGFSADPNTTYEYKIRTVYNNNTSSWSNVRIVNTYPLNVVTGPETGCQYMPNVFTVNLNNVTIDWVAEDADEVYDWDNSLTASWETAGTYDVTANITDSYGNTGSHTVSITINPAPVVSCPNSFSVCVDADLINLNQLQGATPAGGIFIGDGVDDNGNFDPAVAGVGTHTIIYAYQNAQTGCDNYCEFEITVNPLPVVTAPNDMSVCANAAQFNLSGGLPAGGTYYLNGVAITSFNPSNMNPGVYEIEYRYTNTNGCTNSDYFTITVNPLPEITVNGFEVCISATPFQLNAATPAGGTYSGPGVTNNTFNPAVAGLGNHVITYVYTDTNGCTNSAQFTITVIQTPVVTVPNDMIVCIDANPITLSGATPAGGVYSGNGVVNGVFYPAQAGVGNHTITYTYQSVGCTASGTFTISVKPLPEITFPTYQPVCVLDNPFALTATPAGGTFTGNGVVSGMFNPSVAGVGTHTITYTYTDQFGCTSSAQFSIVVTPATVITQHPSDVQVFAGQNATFTVVAQNATSYQWQVSVNNGPWTNISGATNATLTLNNVTTTMNGNRYRVVVSGCGSVTSNIAVLNVEQPLVVPSVQASNINWLSWGRTNINMNWTNGNGTGRIVAAVEGTTFPAWTPSQNYSYAAVANSNFASAAYVDQTLGVKIVFAGNGNGVNVTGLTRNTNYAFHVFEYNQTSAGILYNVTSTTNNPRSRKTALKEGEFNNDNRYVDAPFALSTVSPNPASDNIYFNIEAYEAASFRLELVNTLGEVVFATNFNLSEGSWPMNIPTMDATGRLADGTYMLRLVSNGYVQTQKVVVIK
ncbi:MAG: T9SS type A sorting domain-containing protein [Bacteroidota bacterium]